MRLRRILRIISAVIIAVMCATMCVFGFEVDGKIWVEYKCSFDISALRFSNHFLYDYADDGVFHITLRDIGGAPECTFDSGDKSITVYLKTRSGNSDWKNKGEYYIPNEITSYTVWDKIETNEKGEEYVVGCRDEYLSEALGNSDGDNIAIDMLWTKSGRTIRMYTYNESSRTAAGTFTPTSKMVYYDEDSFKEIQPSGSGLGIETRRLSIFKADDKNWISAPEGTEAADKLKEKYEKETNEINENKNSSEKSNKNDDDRDIKETETTYMSYDVFDPENGVIKNSFKNPSEEYAPVLLETVRFTGRYHKKTNDDLFNKIAEDGDNVSGLIKHYSGDDNKHFFTLTLTGPTKSLTLWYWEYTSRMTREKTTKNKLSFSTYARVENGKAYNYYWKNSERLETYNFRGAVNDNKLTKIGFEVSTYAALIMGTFTSDSVEYEQESAGKADDYGKWLFKVFSVENGSLNTSNLGTPSTYWGLDKDESIAQQGAYYDEDGNPHIVMTNWNDIAVKGKRSEYGDVLDKIEISVPQSLKGVSDNGNTKFELLILEDKIIDDKTREVIKTDEDLILKVSGNIGTKYYRKGNVVWKNPEGAKTSTANIDGNQSYIGWREIKKVNGLWEIGIEDSASMTADFSNSVRTGIDSFEFDFNNETLKFKIEDIDYFGPMLNFFYMGAIEDKTNETAKNLGLLPESLNGLRK